MGRAAVPMPGQAQQDWWIIQELANRMGLSWTYSHPRDVFAEMRLVMPSLTGISWQRLDDEGAVTYPCADENSAGREVIFGDGFPTGRGRVTPGRGPAARRDARCRISDRADHRPPAGTL